ncbi:CDGSH iron-sulfur domain-containing protein 3, mitochondrial [Halotydeus destructor]|nr:CDGSH iron-sulfur domain-containing protein 3, mitochondrial [Halotydeus destructor]
MFPANKVQSLLRSSRICSRVNQHRILDQNSLNAHARSLFTTRLTNQADDPIKVTPGKSNQGKAPEAVDDVEDNLKRNILNIPDAKVHWEYHQDFSQAKIYDKKPAMVNCKEGKIYMYCACGHSKNQPFCDGTHRIQHLRINIRPIPWTCKQSGEYWFCNCKKSSRRPFCDGTHLEPSVKDATDSTVRY